MSDSNQQEQAQMAGQMPMNMAAFGYGGQEAFMNMMRQGQGGGFPQQQQFDANGQPMQGAEGAPGDGQNSTGMGMMQSPYGMPGMYPRMGFDPMQMQQMQMQSMAAFGGFPGMPGFGGMDPSMQGMNPMFFQAGMPQGDVMSQANAALGQAQNNTMNSSAALAGAMNAQGMSGMGANGMMNMNMNPMAAMMTGTDPNMMFRQMQMMQQQAAGGVNIFGSPATAAQQANMFGFGSGAGITAASYLSMAQQAGMGTGASAADMMGSMVGGAGGPILNPFEAANRKGKNRKPKNKPKRPLSAYNVSKDVEELNTHWIGD
jgi:hypothetical protein